ncbi:uncharacterized protein [Dermacentor andersoni]|uniref:uncharacterized protein n=1 Tax=Dermacentor andersoni TaxID=34620 RepID=UPI002417C802|nr:uncharacterized protein LOC129381562 [Dermacentor andersoni]
MAQNLTPCAPIKEPRVSEGQRETVLTFMEQHPQLALRSSKLGPGFTVGNWRRPWQQLAHALNEEGPVIKTVKQWQEWWRKQVFEARHDATTIAQEQRSTGGGRFSVFHGRVLQLTGTVRLRGITTLPYQEWQRIHRAAHQSRVLHGHHVDSDRDGRTPSRPCRRNVPAASNRATRCSRCCGGLKNPPPASLSRQRGQQRLRRASWGRCAPWHGT